MQDKATYMKYFTGGFWGKILRMDGGFKKMFFGGLFFLEILCGKLAPHPRIQLVHFFPMAKF